MGPGFRRARHAPFWDQPDIFNRLLAEFTSEVAGMPTGELEELRKSA